MPFNLEYCHTRVGGSVIEKRRVYGMGGRIRYYIILRRRCRA